MSGVVHEHPKEKDMCQLIKSMFLAINSFKHVLESKMPSLTQHEY